MTTITTVGYGDHHPVTVMGRCVVAGLMIGGVAVLGVVTASVASRMVQSVAEETVAELDAAQAPPQEELRRLAAQIERLTALLEERGLPTGAANPEPSRTSPPRPLLWDWRGRQVKGDAERKYPDEP